jgi:hypothetical protein
MVQVPAFVHRLCVQLFAVLLDMHLGTELHAHDISSVTFGGLTLASLLPPDPCQAQKISDDLMQKISTQNRRALDLVAAKCYYYHARVYEFLDKLDVVRRYGESRSPWDQSPGHH